MMRPPCADREDMTNKWENAKLDEVKEKDMKKTHHVGVDMFAR